MLASISPLGERARGSRWGRTTAAYLVASVAGGAVLGAVLGGIDAELSPTTSVLAVLAAAAAVGAFADLSGRLPSIRRQVNENWLVTYRDWVYGAGFGGQLGLGAVTVVTSAATYLLWLLELVSGSWLAGLMIGASFGVARGLPLLAMTRVDTADRLRATHRRLHAAGRWVNALAIVSQGIAGGLLMVAAVTR